MTTFKDALKQMKSEGLKRLKTHLENDLPILMSGGVVDESGTY